MKRLPFLLLFVSALCYSQTPSANYCDSTTPYYLYNNLFYYCSNGTPVQVFPSTGGTLTGSLTVPGLVNTTTPVRDTTRQFLAASMTAVSTAGVNIGSTGTGNSAFSFPVTATNWYDLECKLPVTFVASATIAFEIVSISGSSTISFVNAETMGNTGASAAFQDLLTAGGTSLAGSLTTTTGAPGGVTEMVTYDAQFLSSHAGNVGLEFIGNGTNNVQMLKGGECGITQIN